MEKIIFISTQAAIELQDSNLENLTCGFFEPPMRWEDYLDKHAERLHPRLEALREAIIKQNIRHTGRIHQMDNTISCPKFEDGTAQTYSRLAWGDLMAAIWSTHENKDYHHNDFK
jgi:hypothetical protein